MVTNPHRNVIQCETCIEDNIIPPIYLSYNILTDLQACKGLTNCKNFSCFGIRYPYFVSSFDILCVERFICIIKCPSTTINSNYLDMLTTITLLLLPQHYSSASNNKYNKMLPRKAGGQHNKQKRVCSRLWCIRRKTFYTKHTIVGNFGFWCYFILFQLDDRI